MNTEAEIPLTPLKRPRSASSPTFPSPTNNRKKKINNMDDGKLKAMMGEVMSGILDEKLKNIATKADIATLEKKVETVVSNGRILEVKVNQISREIINNRSRILIMEKQLRQNNLIFRGIKWVQHEKCETIIHNFCSDTLGIQTSEIVRAHRIGKNYENNLPILVEFSKRSDVANILKNTAKLKGTKFGIDKDYCEHVRQCRKILFTIKKHIKSIRKDVDIYIRDEIIFINKMKLMWHNDTGLSTTEGASGAVALKEVLNLDINNLIEKLRENGKYNNDQNFL